MGIPEFSAATVQTAWDADFTVPDLPLSFISIRRGTEPEPGTAPTLPDTDAPPGITQPAPSQPATDPFHQPDGDPGGEPCKGPCKF